MARGGAHRRERIECIGSRIDPHCPCDVEPCYAATGRRCEDCWANDQLRWHGHDQSVKLWGRPPPEGGASGVVG